MGAFQAACGGGSGVTRILVVDDDAIERRLMQAIFRHAEGFDVVAAEDGAAASVEIARAVPDAIILDVRLPGESGMDILRRLRVQLPLVPVIMLTGQADVRTAVEAIQLGAYNFLTKPVDNDQLVATVRRAVERNQLISELEMLRGKLGETSAFARLLGTSPPMLALAQQIRQVASSGFTVLIMGETGTGKELVARAIHEESGRRAKPLVALDFGAIPENLLESEPFGYEKGAFSGADRKKEGYFQLAEGGTLLLDEMGNLPLAVQAKLLRVLQERVVHSLGSTQARALDLRFVAATNLSLEAEIKAGRFRQDLYFRLAEFVIKVPALRERREDILGLANWFRGEASLELRRPVTAISDGAADVLSAYPWPGNVRELRNVIRQAVLLSTELTIRAPQIEALLGAVAREAPAPVELAVLPGQSLKEIAGGAAAEAERQAIRHALRVCGGNKTKASQLLKIDYKNLHLKIKRYGLGTGE